VGTIRRAVLEDSRAIWALNELPNLGATADPSLPLELPQPSEPPAAFPDLRDVTSGFTDRDGEFLVSEHDGHVVGMGGYRPDDADAVEIMRVRVHPAMRRRRIGADLMAELERRARAAGFREVRLNTATNMPEAIAFYRALGYTETRLESHPRWTWTLMHFAKPLA
jgi:ribosomal protein S18 acetylase RimI-like enzyme